MEEAEVRRIFKKKVSDHIRNVINRVKIKQVKLAFIAVDYLMEINRILQTEKNQQISKQNKKNRSSSSSKGSATYVRGSINIGEHRK